MKDSQVEKALYKSIPDFHRQYSNHNLAWCNLSCECWKCGASGTINLINGKPTMIGSITDSPGHK